MESLPAPASSHEDRLRSASADLTVIKSEHTLSSPRVPVANLTAASFKPSPTPLPSTESVDAGIMAPASSSSTAAKRKSTAGGGKRGAKKLRPGRPKKTKKAKQESADTAPEEASGDDESDSGPYCVCRGPDDHRWMICCEKCEDWFHGECINMNKEIGENLIEKFICPNCSTGDLATIYKKTCSLGACRKPARLAQDQPSVFCSNEHAQTWWERMIGRLPKTKGKNGPNDLLTQEELMALLADKNLGSAGNDGVWNLLKAPFSDADVTGIDSETDIFSEEEKTLLSKAAQGRLDREQETLQCRKMLTIVELAQERRRAAIKAGHFGEDICGYDTRLDSVSARDVFAAYISSEEGSEVLSQGLGDTLGDGDPVRGMCERKRCKTHSGWQKVLPSNVKHQIRELADEASQLQTQDKTIRQAAAERWRRRQAENNWVDHHDE